MKDEPAFVPKPGQVDFTHIRYAPVVNVVATYSGKVLLAKRAPNMRIYPGKWHWIAGFLDDNTSIEDKVREELREEAGINDADIIKLTRGTPRVEEDTSHGKTWLVIPVLAEIRTDKLALNWESSEAAWFEPEELKSLDMPPHAHHSARDFFPELFAD
ncbi:MAG: pyrimidine (deoxy)nucleoside triphosphate pyrophosphohydrolase [Candidatus Saccharibacteria bacterium]|jgi:NADH pyrophosphatase NudC (nudix superfamily)|nr:pyrimidine (deoxy)nucleoside triphosphate pyrophosphohydrolase [Candidatus Saccharibacteria bacterium]